MPEVYVDSYFFACPKPGSEESAFTNYVSELAQLQTTNSRQSVTFLIPANTIETLETLASLPPWERSDIDLYVQREEVSRLLFGLLGKLETIEDYLEIEDLLIDGVGCKPSEFLESRHSGFVDDYHRTMAFLSLKRHFLQDSSHGAAVLTKGLDGPTSVTAFGKIIDIEFLNVGQPVPAPEDYDEEITHIPAVTQLSGVLSAVHVWLAGGISDAINLAIFQRSQSGQGWPDVSYDYSIGEKFVESIASLGFDDDQTRIGMLIRACVHTILEEDMRDTHPLRVSEGSNSRQRTRQEDGASAWRRDVDHEHHLHYWKISSHVQLAAVVQHNDFTIPD